MPKLLASVCFVLLFGAAVCGDKEPRAYGHPFRQLPLAVRGNSDGGADDAVFINRYIEDGRIAEGQEDTKVPPLVPGSNIQSHSGFVTVDKNTNENMFFWLFKSNQDWETAPIVISVQGGVADSLFIGVFEESGPYYLTENGTKAHLRHITWVDHFNVLYIDAPAGVGYSFTQFPEDKYLLSIDQIVNKFSTSIDYVFRLFPELAHNRFLFAGEGNVGRVGLKLAHQYKFTDLKTFMGILMGNPWIDVSQQLDYSEHLYQVGYFDKYSRDLIKKSENKVHKNVKAGNYDKAGNTLLDIFEYIGRRAGVKNMENYVAKPPTESSQWDKFVQTKEIRKALHVSNFYLHDGEEVYNAVKDELTAPTTQELIDLINLDKRVAIYSGQYNVFIPPVATANLLENLQWSGAEDFKRGGYAIFYDTDGAPSVYTKSVGYLTSANIRHAGARTITEKPLIVRTLLDYVATGIVV